ncbi:MAG TPA: hypothetical protein VNJ47_02295, partial [Nevskiales bacterium]|nr:hypothetical protein [Nevskiales bacterium]
MRMKQMTPALAAMLLGLASTSLAAAPATDEAAAEPARRQEAGGVQIIIRSDAEKQRRDSGASAPQAPAASNRHPDPGATRGLDRAAERRAEAAEAHSQAEPPDTPWYKSLFGGSDESGDRPG